MLVNHDGPRQHGTRSGSTNSSGERRAVGSAGKGRAVSGSAGSSARGNGRTAKAGGRVSGPLASKTKPGPRSGGPGGRSHGKNTPKRRHRVLKWVLGILGLLLVAGIAAFAYLYVTTEVPPPEKFAMAEKTTVYYADGSTELGSFAEQNREIISCEALPKQLGQAIVSSENRSFYKDKGIDLKGIGRALLNNLTTGSRQGGSTITQQYAERYYLGETTSYMGKLHEAFLALKITQSQGKDQVLCNYMNTIYLGRGAYGIQAAAKAYFNKDAKDLTISESAMLAGIIPAPSNWDPALSPKQAESRFKRVINIMKEDGYISAKEAREAKMPQTVPYSAQNVYAGQQGYLLQMVRNELIDSKAFTKDDLDTGGYKITTTIDKGRQDLMFKVASPSQDGNGVVPEGLQVGSMSVNTKDGSIISLYAGDDYPTTQLNNATQALYEPGSTMKPFALLAAVQAGVNLNTTFNGNSPRVFENISSPVQNYGNRSYGATNLYNATANSINTVYMDLQQKLGAKTVAQTANMAGISPKRVSGDNPFTVLGNDSVHITDMAQAYATIANRGNKPILHIVAAVKDPAGKDMYKAPTTGKPVFTANDTDLVAKAMTGTVQYGTATEVRRVGHPVAGKSGTANDNTAGSFVGFTPSVLSVFAVWNPGADGNPQPVPAFGRFTDSADYPVHMFTEYMTQALADAPVENFPVAKDTGKIGGPDGSWGYGGASNWSHQNQQRNTEKPQQQGLPQEEQHQPQPQQQQQQQPQQEQQQGSQGAAPEVKPNEHGGATGGNGGPQQNSGGQ
ncbi:penicillin-binding protein [Bifidobacterium aemilianum]|uniref:Penicillin-binding protein n=1 Tax=Bifidobacterium aemilianum TaxID=2493120 RepID=A0A366K922_9BIFI|nr:transglycosylase domain-containing protein [Bifidobacterium aemilianum]RBP97742.1 penicillin-binding protein [Bifidobacterium aemilianum]